MANKKINELDSRATLSLADLMVVGDSSTGYAYKTTITDIKSLIGGGVVSFNGRVGAIVPTEGDYSLTQLSDVIITTATSGQVLRYNGTSWVNATETYTGTVTSVGLSSATSGVTIGSSPITTSGDITIAIATASGSQNGLLSSTDWTTFNSKQGAITLTTTGTSGASTLIGNTLNIPQYSGTNIYNADGTLTSARTLTSGGFGLTFTGSNTASSAIARGLNLAHTLVASANNDVLVGLDIAPTFTVGSFTGTSSIALRVTGNTSAIGNVSVTGAVTATSFLRGSFASTITGQNGALRASNSANTKRIDIGFDETYNSGFIGCAELSIDWLPLLLQPIASISAPVIIGKTTNDGVNKVQVLGSGIFSSNLTANSFIKSGGTSAQILAADGSVITAGTGITISGGTISSSGGGGGSDIYTADGTLTSDRTITSSGNSLTILGGKETFAGFQRALWLKTSTNAKNSVELIFENTFTTTGKTFELASYSDGTFNITDRTSSILRLKIDANYFQFHSSASANANLLGLVAGINALWFNQIASSATVSNYTLCNSGGLTLLNAPTGGNIRFRIANADKMMLTNAGRLLLGTTTEATFLLDVNGTGRFSGILNIDTLRGTQSTLYIDGLGVSNTIAYRAASHNFTGNVGIVGTLSCADSFTVQANSGSVNSIVTSANLSSFRITKTASSSTWYFENNRNAVVGSLEISNSLTSACLTLFSSRSISIGSYTENTTAILNIESTTKGFLPPRMTTTQKNAIATPAAGLVVYDTILAKLCVYNGTAWETITSA